MVNPPTSTNITVSEELYYKLDEIRKIKGYTFNELISELCELDFKYNYIEKTVEYSLITETTSRLFKVTFKKENMIVEYYNPDKGYDRKIGNWELNKKSTNAFYEFIKNDAARCILENVPISIEFKDFIIKRIG